MKMTLHYPLATAAPVPAPSVGSKRSQFFVERPWLVSALAAMFGALAGSAIPL